MLNSGPFVTGLQQRVEQLEDDLQIARDRIKELEAALGIGDDLLPLRRLGLSPQEAAVVNVLMRRETATREQLLHAMYAIDPERRFDVIPNIANVALCKARKKLAMVGVAIPGSPRARGMAGEYRMLGPDKARLARLVASKAALLSGRSSDMRCAQARHAALNRPLQRAAE